MCQLAKFITISLSQVNLQQDTQVYSIISELQKDQCNICHLG